MLKRNRRKYNRGRREADKLKGSFTEILKNPAHRELLLDYTAAGICSVQYNKARRFPEALKESPRCFGVNLAASSRSDECSQGEPSSDTEPSQTNFIVSPGLLNTTKDSLGYDEEFELLLSPLREDSSEDSFLTACDYCLHKVSSDDALYAFEEMFLEPLDSSHV